MISTNGGIKVLDRAPKRTPIFYLQKMLKNGQIAVHDSEFAMSIEYVLRSTFFLISSGFKKINFVCHSAVGACVDQSMDVHGGLNASDQENGLGDVIVPTGRIEK